MVDSTMDWRLIFFTSYEVFISIILGIVTVFVTLKVLNKTLLRVDDDSELKKGNTALAIFAGTIIISILILVQSSVAPSIDAMRTMVIGQGEITSSIVLTSLLYFLMLFGVAVILSILFVFISLGIYMKATPNIDEVAEVKASNTAVAILMSVVILGMALFIRPSMQNLISSLVNYNDLEKTDGAVPGQRISPK